MTTRHPTMLGARDVERLLEPWLPDARVLQVDLMPGGLMNRNLRLRLAADPGTCVLRLYDRDPAACARELSVLGALRGRVPVPEVLFTGSTESGVPFAILSYMEGISLAELRRGDAGSAAVGEAAYDAGLLLPRLREFAGPGMPPGFDQSMRMIDVIDLFAASSAFQRRVSQALLDRVLQFVAEWEPRADALHEPPTLVHSDFNARNILVHSTAAGWRVSAILDWEFARSGSPLADVGNFLRYHRPPSEPRYEPHFSRGIRDGGMQLPDEWLTLARWHDLAALCEMLGRDSLPESLVPELRQLLSATVEGH